MNEQSPSTLDAYYKEAASWNRDRQEELRRSRLIAWWAAGAAGVIAVLEAFALIALAPLKTVVPYTLMVDRTTGYVQALKPLETDKVSPDTALTQSQLVQYVIARESFDIDTIEASYRKAALWSAERARSDYLGEIQVSNPQSPLSLYPRTTIVETRVKSVSPIGRNVALVRFDTLRKDSGRQAEFPRSWVAVIRYRYSGEPLKLEDRFINPLGFQVVRYRRDAEATMPVQEAPPAAPVQQRGVAAVTVPPEPGYVGAATIASPSALSPRSSVGPERPSTRDNRVAR